MLPAAAASVLAALALFAFGLTLLFKRHVERRVHAEHTVFLDQIVGGLDRAPDSGFVLSREPADPRFEQPLSGFYWQDRADDRLRPALLDWEIPRTSYFVAASMFP